MRDISIIIIVLLMAACGGKTAMPPSSSGKPYEVWVKAATKEQAEGVMQTLQTTVAGLPQEEPCFDSKFCPDNKWGSSEQLARNIVTIDIDPMQYSKASMTYERNTNARPQLIIHLQAPSQHALNNAIHNGSRYGKALLSLLNRHELTIQSQTLRKQHNPKAEQQVRTMFNIDMAIPADMRASKTGNRFLWLSNNAADGMTNVCVFDSDNIDSVLKVNIPGEEDGMYMKTVAATITGNDTFRRGLWEMENDAMGGPFVARTLTDNSTCRKHTVMAFVYAPGTTKRNKMRQLEAVLYSIRDKQSEGINNR